MMVAACPFPARQGTQVYVRECAEALVARGHEVGLVCYGFGEGAEIFDARASFRVLRAARVPGHAKVSAGPSWEKPLADFGVLWRAWQEASSGRYDLIHAHNYEGALAGWAAARLSGLPWVYHAHNTMGDELETYFEGALERGLARGLGEILDRAVPRLADGGLSVSRAALARLERLGSAPPKMVYVPPAVEVPEAWLAGEAPEPVWDLVYVGNLDGYQGLERLWGALALLQARGWGGKCAVVTAEPAAKLQALVAPSGVGERVEHVPHGAWEEAWGQLRRGRVAVLPREVASGFPIKLLVYIKAGRPVVACEGGAQGLGAQDGVWVVRGAEGLAQACWALLTDDEARAAWGARASEAAAGHSWARAVGEIERVYEGVVSGG